MSEAKGRLVAVADLEGGSGESTLAVHLAGALAERGHRVTLLDADPRRAAFFWARRAGLPVFAEREAVDSVVAARRCVTPLPGLLDPHFEQRLSHLGETLAPPVRDHPRRADCFAAGIWIGGEPACASAYEECHRLADAVEGGGVRAPDAPLRVQARRAVEPAPAPLRRPLRHLVDTGGRSFWPFRRHRTGPAADRAVLLDS